MSISKSMTTESHPANSYEQKKKWSDFYSSLTIEDHLCNLSRHRFFLTEMLKKKPKRIVEVGVGSATISIFLSHLGIEVIGIDNSREIIEKARKNCVKLNAKVEFILADGLSPLPLRDDFDIAFSQGVAEHFSDVEIESFVKYQLKVGKRVFFITTQRVLLPIFWR